MAETVQRPDVREGVSEVALDSWGQFAPCIATMGPAIIYRGQADAEWKIESTLDRHERRFPTKYINEGGRQVELPCRPVPRDKHFGAFKEAVRGKRGSNPQDLSENEWWALAQHHGLATPLLDWTYSPFVALFFAFEEEGYIDWPGPTFHKPKKRAVYAASYHVAGNDIEAKSVPFVFSPRHEITHRLGSQSGVFMRMPKGADLEASVRARYVGETPSSSNHHAQAYLYKITIPSENADRLACLKFLNKMNINRMSLFSDLDGAARYVNSLWEIDFDTALGYLPDGNS